MAWYRTGTVSVTNGSATVTGVGTDFINGTASGEGLYAPDGRLYEIATIVSATQLTLGSSYLGTTASAQPYAIAPTQSYLRDLALSAATLVNTYSTTLTNVSAGLFQDGTVSLPGISFVNNTNTGIRRTGTGAYSFVASGVDQAAISTTGLTLRDDKFRITGSADLTKVAVFEVDGLTTATTRTYTLPDATTTVVGTDNVQTLTNKTVVAEQLRRKAPVVKTASFTVGASENWLICSGSASITVTLPDAATFTGREVMLKTTTAFTVVSATANVVPLVGGTAGTAILAATAGKWATLVSDGTSWQTMQAA